jgi:uncharacterized membrane protein
MATLIAIGYPDQGTAGQALSTVRRLEAELIIQADQVAAISRDREGKLHTETGHGAGGTAGGAAMGGMWGFLFGILFFVPFGGLALGAEWGRCSATSVRRGSTRHSSSRYAITSSRVCRRCSW